MRAKTSKALVKRAVGTPRPRTRSASARPLLADVRGLILAAREGVARAVNSGLVLLYWEIGRRIRQDILREKRAEYGEQIVYALSRQLTVEFGRGFSRRNLFNMIRFAEVCPDPKIVQALTAQLGWTHWSLIIYLDDPLKRDFYAEMCRVERWNTRTLGKKIQSMLFERTALSRKPEKLIRQELDRLKSQDTLTPGLVFRDPYMLDFLGLKDTYAEKDLEAAILREMEAFIGTERSGVAGRDAGQRHSAHGCDDSGRKAGAHRGRKGAWCPCRGPDAVRRHG